MLHLLPFKVPDCLAGRAILHCDPGGALRTVEVGVGFQGELWAMGDLFLCI